jgi:hypothetical protein
VVSPLPLPFSPMLQPDRHAYFPWDPATIHTILLYNHASTCSQHSSWTAWPLKMRPVGCLKILVSNYQHTLRDNPEEWWTHFLSNREKRFVFTNFKPGKDCGLAVGYRVINITAFVCNPLEWMVNS